MARLTKEQKEELAEREALAKRVAFFEYYADTLKFMAQRHGIEVTEFLVVNEGKSNLRGHKPQGVFVSNGKKYVAKGATNTLNNKLEADFNIIDSLKEKIEYKRTLTSSWTNSTYTSDISEDLVIYRKLLI